MTQSLELFSDNPEDIILAKKGRGYPIQTPYGKFNSIAEASREIMSRNDAGEFLIKYRDYSFLFDPCSRIRNGRNLLRHYAWNLIKALCFDPNMPEWFYTDSERTPSPVKIITQ